MQTKYTLHIDSQEYELNNDDLRNWEDVKCSCKRSDYGGIERTFTSQFEFVQHAMELLRNLYLRDGVNAKAEVLVSTLDDDWRWEERFRCPLDFTSVSWDSFSFTINGLDNTLAAILKANKSTKYEMLIGTDIKDLNVLNFDRIPMIENVTYEFTQGESFEDIPDIIVPFERNVKPWMGSVGREICINKMVYFTDDQEDTEDGYLLEAYQDVKITLEYSLEWRIDDGSGSITLALQTLDSRGNVIGQTVLATPGASGWTFEGEFNSSANLPDPNNYDPAKDSPLTHYASVNGIAYYVTETGHLDRPYQWVSSGKKIEDYVKDSKSGKITLSLKKGEKVAIGHSFLSPTDVSARIRFTESEFKFSWVAIGHPETILCHSPKSVLTAILEQMNLDFEPTIEISNYDRRLADTYLIAAESARGITGAKLCSSFGDFADWMSAVFGYIYTVDGTTLRFLHRSELFSASECKSIPLCRDLSYNVDASAIYSSVTIGYDKKDYNSINGRDEFNFSNTYSTGCTASDKTLSLISKYRADSYGLEFAVQKRGETSTDNSSDNDVFFILARNGKPVRDCNIKGSLNDSHLFNADFSPMACVRANAGFIGLQSNYLTLLFASSTGNSDVELGGEKMSGNLTLGKSFATASELEFTTDTLPETISMNELLEVEDDGIVYRGFIKEVDITYAKAESAKYKLIVKDIQI